MKSKKTFAKQTLVGLKRTKYVECDKILKLKLELNFCIKMTDVESDAKTDETQVSRRVISHSIDSS